MTTDPDPLGGEAAEGDYIEQRTDESGDVRPEEQPAEDIQRWDANEADVQEQLIDAPTDD
jgi:hypothetical protein